MVVPTDPLFLSERRHIAELAIAAELPIVCGFREHVEDGALMSYGIDLRENLRHAAAYVDKILKGAKPADLPIEQPTKFELVINLKTAKALGLKIPFERKDNQDQEGREARLDDEARERRQEGDAAHDRPARESGGDQETGTRTGKRDQGKTGGSKAHPSAQTYSRNPGCHTDRSDNKPGASRRTGPGRRGAAGGVEIRIGTASGSPTAAAPQRPPHSGRRRVSRRASRRRGQA